MNQMQSDEPQTRDKARASFQGARLTDAQFDEAWNIVGTLHRETQRSGSFIKKLTDYAHTFAGRDKIDASREETVLRDIYYERFGQSISKTREGLAERERLLREARGSEALNYARQTLGLIQDGETMPHYLASDRTAVAMARQHGISEVGAKKVMAEAFEAADGKPFYETCKEFEALYHRPAWAAKQAAQQVTKTKTRSRTRA